MAERTEYVVAGGGIAGVSCAEELSRLHPEASIHLISPTPLIKAVTNFTRVSRTLEQFEVKEKPASYLSRLCPNVAVHQAKLHSINVSCRTAKLSNGCDLNYDRICLCTGATPALIAENHPRVVGIRDVESVKDFQSKLQDARRIVVVGNGGIATEMVYEVKGCQVVWAIKDHSIGRTFFDEGAATFFLPHLESETSSRQTGGSSEGEIVEVSPLKRLRYVQEKEPTGLTDRLKMERTRRKGEKNDKEEGQKGITVGGALGPDWHADLKMTGKSHHEVYRHVHVEYECEVKEIMTPQEFKDRGCVLTPFPTNRKPRTKGDVTSCEKTGSVKQDTAVAVSSSRTKNEGDCAEATGSEFFTSCDETGSEKLTSCEEEVDWGVYVKLTNGTVFGCDLIVSATGVTPSAGGVAVMGGTLALAEDGGIGVDHEMRTNLERVYAAGDVCSAQWGDHSNVWFQMRLWTQARQMGAYAARCMAAHISGESMTLDFCFELFTHVTTFFGYKVVLLGLYNGQTLGKDYQIQLRWTKGVEYIKLVLRAGRLVGAVLIGETDLEETFENLILNQMDLSHLNLLEPSVDLEDFFD